MDTLSCLPCLLCYFARGIFALSIELEQLCPTSMENDTLLQRATLCAQFRASAMNRHVKEASPSIDCKWSEYMIPLQEGFGAVLVGSVVINEKVMLR